MSLEVLSPIICAASLLSGYLIYANLKMASKATASSNGPKSAASRFSEWWTTRKIGKWKNENKTTDNYKVERLDNKHFKFFGCSQNGESLFVDIRNKDGVHDANFTLRLKDGTYLTIPDYPVKFSSSGELSISSKGLTIEAMLPYSKWRITFNGLIDVNRAGAQDNNTEVQSQHVNFSFFWIAASDPLSWPNNWSTKLLYRAFSNIENIEGYLNKLSTADNGFDQFGSLLGQVTIENGDSKDVIEMNLPGFRTSRDIVDKTLENTGNVWSLIASCKDGFIISLSARTVENETKIFSGCVRMPSMEVHQIEDINLNVVDFEIEQETKEICFDINANGKTFKSVIKITPNSSQTIQSAGFSTTKTQFSIDVNGQPGRGFITSATKCQDLDRGVESVSLPHLDVPQYPNDYKLEKSALFFNDPEAQCEQFCGGKGSSLAYLTQLANNQKNEKHHFVVPEGFTLTTHAFDIQLKNNQPLRDAIAKIEDIAYQRCDGQLEKACEEASKLFIETSIEDEIVDDIKRAYLILKNNTGSSLKVAVRSSAIGEDGVESSSAGQNETFLGVQSIDNVLVAIQKCWTSLFTVQSVTYRVQNIQPVNTKMSVVVQSMVAPDCAGVLFTQHPVSKDPSKLLITANYGLGESVVSGLVDPDMFVVQRSYKNNNLEVVERKLGQKDSFVLMSAEDEVNSAKVSDDLRKKLCLTDEFLLKLCEIGIILEESYKTPRDIEWAIYENTIYLLQSRPMTSTRSFSAWEVLHEFDTSVMSEEDFFTFGNVGEVMSQAMTPLTISTLIPSFERGLVTNFLYWKKSQFFSQLMGVSHSRIAMNVFSTFLRYMRPEISMENRVHGIAVMGHEFITEEIHKIGIHRYGIVDKFTEMRFILHAFRTGWNVKADVEEMNGFMKKFTGTYNRNNLTKFQSLGDLYSDITLNLGDNFTYMESMHAKTTMMCTVYQMILFSTMAEGKKDMTADYLKDITVLLSSCENAESAEVPTMLEEIAAELLKFNRSKALEFSEISIDKGIAWLTENCPRAKTLFEAFIERHAHRGFQEFDFGYETWGMNPTLVIEMLQRTIRNWNNDDPNKKRNPKRTNEEILAELKTPTKSMTRRTIQFFLPRCQASVILRERTKSQLIAFVHEIRKAFCYLAEKMQQEGLLPDKDLIFYLTHQEIGTILNDRSRSDLISKATRRRRLYPEWKKLRFDEFQWGVMKPQNTDTEIAADCEKVVGTPVCEGKITGRACVVKTFAEVHKIKAGDILITYCTDIAWSPYFPILSGVVTELGGLISHGAVVAREYGLPCIVGATNATNIITDGEQICMDANNGVIIKLGKEQEI